MKRSQRAFQMALCLLGTSLFFFFTSVAPYTANQVYAQNITQELADDAQGMTTSLMEEKMEEVDLPTYKASILLSEIETDLFFIYIPLSPQNDPSFSHKPPSTTLIFA